MKNPSIDDASTWLFFACLLVRPLPRPPSSLQPPTSTSTSTSTSSTISNPHLNNFRKSNETPTSRRRVQLVVFCVFARLSPPPSSLLPPISLLRHIADCLESHQSLFYHLLLLRALELWDLGVCRPCLLVSQSLPSPV